MSVRAYKFSEHLIATSLLLEGNNLLDSNGSLDGAADLVLSLSPRIADLLRHGFRVWGEVNIGLLVSALVHEGELALLSDINNFPFGTVDHGNGGSVGGGYHIFELLASEDINGGEIAFSVAVLSGLGDGNVKDLAWLSLDHDVSSLLDLSSLHGDGGGGTGVGALDGVFIIRHGG